MKASTVIIWKSVCICNYWDNTPHGFFSECTNLSISVLICEILIKVYGYHAQGR